MVNNSKVISVMISLVIISLLVFTGVANAVKIELSKPLDVNAGEPTRFKVWVDIENLDRNVPIEYSDVEITGPGGFREVCRVYQDGSYDNCDLDLNIIVDIHERSFGYGYGYSNGYDFGYGYGYNPVRKDNEDRIEVFGEIVYHVEWRTSKDTPTGNYSVNLIAVAKNAKFKSNSESFKVEGLMGFYCSQLFKVYQDGRINYDFRVDLNEDNTVDVVDLGYLSQKLKDEDWCFNQLNKIQEFEEDNSLFLFVEGDGIAGDPSKKFRIDQNIEELNENQEENLDSNENEPNNLNNLLTGAAVFLDNLEGNPLVGILILLFLILLILSLVLRKRNR